MNLLSWIFFDVEFISRSFASEFHNFLKIEKNIKVENLEESPGKMIDLVSRQTKKNKPPSKEIPVIEIRALKPVRNDLSS